MPALDHWDTGYRSSDWDERPDYAKRLDYHDSDVDCVASMLHDDIRKLCRTMEDPTHNFDHTRNVLALLIRMICHGIGMSPEQMQSFACGLGAQACREEHIRLFNHTPELARVQKALAQWAETVLDCK